MGCGVFEQGVQNQSGSQGEAIAMQETNEIQWNWNWVVHSTDDTKFFN